MWKTPALFLGFAAGLLAADSHSGTTLPPTCVADLGNSYYNVFYNTTNRTPYFCSADNVWTAYGGAGSPGSAGPKGDTGDTGTQGAQGDVGPQGASGKDGAPGAQGIQGPPGADSIVPGPKGDKGDPGDAGTQGIQGIQGIQGPPGDVPSGSIILTLAAACPTGFTAVAELDGKMALGTTVAAKDVGTAGGSDAITPAGSNSSPALTMNAYTPAGTNGTAAFTPAGSNATSTVTPLGSNATSLVTPLGSVAAPVISWPAGVPTFAGTASTAIVNHVHVQSVGTAATGSLVGYTYDASTNTSTAAGYSTANPTTGGVASYTPVGTNSWPAGVPTNTSPAFTGSSSTVAAQTFTGAASTVAAQTFTGTPGTVPAQAFTGTQATLTGSVAAPAFTGTQFDNRSAFVKVLFCSAN